MPEMQQNKQQQIGGHHAQLWTMLNYQIWSLQPSSGSFTFGEKWKPFDHWKEDAVMKFNLNGSIK